jgi:hypothetical protein
LRYPAIIGPGYEVERVQSFEMVRGSSASADNVLLGENMLTNGKGNVIDGAHVTFTVQHGPIVTGDGTGTFATEPSQVIIQVNGENTPIQSVDGANGTITLVDAPSEGDLVVANYYFKRRDTFIENEDLTVQANGTARTFKVHSSRIVNGTNGGTSAVTADITGTATTIINGVIVTVPVISVMVNGAPYAIESLTGGFGTFTLTLAPAAGAEVLVSYFANDWQNTFDILPAAAVTEIIQVGRDPGRTDFGQGTSYALANGNEIHWGNSYSVEANLHSVGGPEFGKNQINAYMTDWRYYMYQAGTGTAAGTKSFTLPFVPVRGDGTGRPISDPYNGTPGATTFDDFKVFVGTSPATAVEVDVSTIVGSVFTLTVAPAAGALVFVDTYVSKYVSDQWLVSVVTPDGAGLGTYTVSGAQYGTVRQIKVGATTTSVVSYMDTGLLAYDPITGTPTCNAYIAPSRIYGDEIITLTIDGSGNFIVTSNVTTGTGSGAINTGVIGQTYVDAVTGFTIGLETATAGILVLNVTKLFKTGTAIERGIANLNFNVSDTANLTVGDSAYLNTYNLNFVDQPNVGEYYYATFDKEKQDYTTKYVTSFPEVLRLYGPLSQNNPIVIAANIAFMNGAQALALKQVLKAPGSANASYTSYVQAIDIFNDPLSNDTRPALLLVLTTESTVINYLKTVNMQQSSIRMRNERTSYFGFAVGTEPNYAMGRAKGVNSELMTAVYPDGGVITVPDSNGVDQDIQVGGEYLAVAIAGQDVSPTRDVATPLTNVEIIGLKRLNRKLNLSIASQVAQAGITVFENRYGSIKVMMALTTDLTSALTRDPRIVEIKHFVQQGVRSACDPFIGLKMLPSLTTTIQRSLTNYFSSLKSLALISGFQGIKATVDPLDPTTINVVVYYKPIFGLNWIVVTHFMRSTL